MRNLWLNLFLLGFCGTLYADSLSGMKGTDSWNEGIVAAPAPQNLLIDGKLDQWNLDGQIWTGNSGYRNVYSVKTAAMWDKDFLYLSFVWKDPTPLHSRIDPDSRSDKGWVCFAPAEV